MFNSAQERLTSNINTLLGFTKRRQSALAIHMGISQPHVSNLLNGKRLWQVEDLDSVADFFSVTVSDLFRATEGAFERRSGAERRSRVDRRAGNWRRVNGVAGKPQPPAPPPTTEEEDRVASRPFGTLPETTTGRDHDSCA